MMNQTTESPLLPGEYLLFSDSKFLSEPLFTGKLNEFDRKLLRLHQMIQGMRNEDALEDELFFLEQISVCEEFSLTISNQQLASLCERVQLILSSKEAYPISPESEGTVYLINRAIKLTIAGTIAKILSKREAPLDYITTSIEKFINSSIDLVYELLLSDSFYSPSCAFACFRCYEKPPPRQQPVEAEAEAEEPSIEPRGKNFAYKLLRTMRRLMKSLLSLHLNDDPSNRLESFLEKYELLMVSALRQSSYFTHYAGLLILANLLSFTDASYHVALYRLLIEIGGIVSQPSIDRVFCVHSEAEAIHTQIFANIARAPRRDQLEFFTFLHDGVFVDICYPYKFTQAKFAGMVPQFSSTLKKSLTLFYDQSVKNLVEDFPNYVRKQTDFNALVDDVKIIAVFMKTPALFAIDVQQLYADLKSTLEILKTAATNNVAFPHVIDIILTIVIFHIPEKMEVQEIAGLLGYTSKQSALSKVVRAKIFFLLMYAPSVENTQQIEELKQVQLKMKFSRLFKEVQGNAKLECLVLHCLELYFNSPDIKDLESDIDPEVMGRFLDFLQNKATLVCEKSLCLESSSPPSEHKLTGRPFTDLVDNLAKSGSILLYISKIRSMISTIPMSEKDFIGTKLREVAEELNL